MKELVLSLMANRFDAVFNIRKSEMGLAALEIDGAPAEVDKTIA
jgi:hypothetical protein